MAMSEMIQVHTMRVKVLKEILEVSDIVLNALKVNDLDILENALARKAELIAQHDGLLADHPEYRSEPLFHEEDAVNLLKRIEALDQESFAEHDRMKARLEAEQAGNRKQINVLNRRKSIESAYGYGSGGHGGHVLDGKK